MEFWSLKINQIDLAIKSHYYLQLRQYFSEVKHITGGLAAYSKHVDDSFIWNHAILGDAEDRQAEQFVTEMTNYYESKSRTCAVYFSPASRGQQQTLHILEARGFQLMDEEAWMFYLDEHPPKYEIPSDIQLLRAENRKQIDDFVDVFNASYEGIAPSYGRALKEQFLDPAASTGVNHYMFYSQGKPVAISTLILKDGYAGIYNVGTLPTYRKRGLGSVISKFTTEQALKMGCKMIFLQSERTAEGPEHIYRRLGFSTVFVRLGYVLQR